MLLSISTKDHNLIQHVGLYVENSDEKIRQILDLKLVPNADILDTMSFDLLQHVEERFHQKELEFKEYQERYAKWKEKFDQLSEEDQEKFWKERYLEGFEPMPVAVEKFDGVIIGEDIPNYLTVFLVGKFWQVGYKTYFNCYTEEQVVTGYNETEIDGVLEPKMEPSGIREHKIFLLRATN